jgi:hypothetical protein
MQLGDVHVDKHRSVRRAWQRRRSGSNPFTGCNVQSIAAVVIVTSARMGGGMVIPMRQRTDVRYQRERQQDQQADGDQRSAAPRSHDRKIAPLRPDVKSGTRLKRLREV